MKMLEKMVSEAGFEPAHPNMWALAPQASVSAVPPLRQIQTYVKVRKLFYQRLKKKDAKNLIA